MNPVSCILNLFRKPAPWLPIIKGPVTIHGQSCRIIYEPTVEEGRYVLQRNRHGDERYEIERPDGSKYFVDPSEITIKPKAQ